jgi:GH25 family lysozyme M1 (1,4-beta-N-acetylmuramidase)
LRTQAKLVGMDLSRITKDCECDCSSFVAVCCECAGIPVPYPSGNAITTSNMKVHLMNTGYFDLLTDSKYLNSEKYLQRGDILVVVSSHTIIALENGIMADISKIEAPKPNQIKAIDLSKYNIITDYKQMANEISHVIIRVGYRSSTSGNIIEDDLFQKHITNCISNGINNLGIYFYDQSINEQEAIEQANWVLDKIKPYNITLPIYIDSEAMKDHNGRADNISKEQRTKNILAFCNRIQELGFKAGAYASNSWFKSMVNFDQIKHFNIWCARYSTQKPTISKYDIWQYGSEQFIWGQKPIDVNWIYNLSTDTQKVENGANKSEIKICNKVCVSDYLNVRQKPLINATIVDKLYNKMEVPIFGYVHDWYMISTDMNRWVSSKYISTTLGKTTANLNYREGVGTNNKSLGVYEKGTIVKLLNKATINNELWYLCLDENDRFGWCSGKYIE